MRLWYHVPFEFDVQVDGALEGWSPDKAAPSYSQSAYFHKFVSDGLWGENAPLRFVRSNRQQLAFRATRIFRGEDSEDRTTFVCSLEDASLHLDYATSRDARGLGILVLQVSLTGLEEAGKLRTPTLADAQNMLEWVRRIFPRWWNNEAPGDAIFSMSFDDKTSLYAPGKDQMALAAQGMASNVMPWIAKLLKPFLDKAGQLAHFGDDRSYMTSAIALDPGGSLPILSGVHP